MIPRPQQDPIIFSRDATDALVAYLISYYNESSPKSLGRTILQKLCYFAKASGVPFPFRFEIYHYGPFSQEIFDAADRLQWDAVIEDRSGDPGRSEYVTGPNLDFLLDRFSGAVEKYKGNLERVAKMFSQLNPSQMELVSTIHYIYASHREWFKVSPSREDVVESVLRVKGEKFDKATVEYFYDAVSQASLLN
jgi:uncharacterized protein